MYDIPKYFTQIIQLNLIKSFQSSTIYFSNNFTYIEVLFPFFKWQQRKSAVPITSGYLEWTESIHAYLLFIIDESITISQSACNGSTGPDHRWSNRPEGMLLLPAHIRSKLSTFFPEASTAGGFVFKQIQRCLLQIGSNLLGRAFAIQSGFLTASGPVPAHEQLWNVCHKSAAVDWNRFVWDRWLLQRPPHPILFKIRRKLVHFLAFTHFTFDVSF